MSEASGSSGATTAEPDGSTDTTTRESDTTTSESDTTMNESESTDEETSGSPVCGDGILEGFEACEGLNLGDETCESQGPFSGTLACAPNCQFDLTGCNMPLGPRLLLSVGDELQQRELDGTLVNTTVVPLEGGTEHDLRSLTHSNGVTYMYRGTFHPTMTYFDTDLPGWVHESFPGWSTVNSSSFGGLAHTEDWIWATDMGTAQDPDPDSESGLVRFSLLGLPTERVMDGVNYIDVFAGLDGFVYALRDDGKTVDVLDPGVELPIVLDASEVRAVAVDEDGTILAASWDGNIYLMDETGAVLMSLDAGVDSLVDIDLASDGTIAVGGDDGDVVIVEPGLGNILESFFAGPDPTFVEFFEFP